MRRRAADGLGDRRRRRPPRAARRRVGRRRRRGLRGQDARARPRTTASRSSPAPGSPQPIAYRWKTQINENAKIPAFSHELPELDHNEIVGWEGAAGARPLRRRLPRRRRHAPARAQRIELTRELDRRAGDGHVRRRVARRHAPSSASSRSSCSATSSRSTSPCCAASTRRRSTSSRASSSSSPPGTRPAARGRGSLLDARGRRAALSAGCARRARAGRCGTCGCRRGSTSPAGDAGARAPRACARSPAARARPSAPGAGRSS